MIELPHCLNKSGAAAHPLMLNRIIAGKGGLSFERRESFSGVPSRCLVEPYGSTRRRFSSSSRRFSLSDLEDSLSVR